MTPSCPLPGYWNEVYWNEGHIWGEQESHTAERLNDHLNPGSRVFDIGYGYGRDILFLVQQGHRVNGVELSAIALQQAYSALEKYAASDNAHVMLGQFAALELIDEYYDAALSHCTFEFLNSPGQDRAYAQKAAHLLRANGTLFVTVCSDPSCYKRGDLKSHWDKERFEQVFGAQFNIHGFEESQETEILDSRTVTFPTLMMKATRKSTLPDNAP